MKTILSERNLVVLLFVMVLITFSLAHEDTKKMESLYNGATISTNTAAKFQQPQVNNIPTTTSLTVIPAGK